MVYYTWKEIAKHVEIIKAEFDIFAWKTQGVNGWIQRLNLNPVSIQTKISSLTEQKDNIFLKPKMTEHGERVDDRWRLDTGG